MASKRNFAYFVKEMVFVSTRQVNALVLSIKKEREKWIMQRTIVSMERANMGAGNVVDVIANMEKGNLTAGRGVEVDVFVSMGNIKRIAGVVVVVRCARPHTVLPIKIANMMDTVGIALPICFRISLLYVIFGRRRTLLQLFLKKSFLMLPESGTRVLKMGAPGEGLTFSWIWEVTS